MNEDMKRILEELEQDLLKEDIQETKPVEEDLLEDLPWQFKTQKIDADIDAILANDAVEQENHTDDIPVNSPAEEDDIDAILAKLLSESDDNIGAEPAFEDPDKPDMAEEPVAYCNYSNDYGNNTAKEEKAAQEKAKSEDKWLITLMGVASALCLGIIGVLIYWMQLIP